MCRKLTVYPGEKMTKARMLEIDEKMDQALTSICDAALRFNGVQIMDTVMEVATAIRNCQAKSVVVETLN